MGIPITFANEQIPMIQLVRKFPNDEGIRRKQFDFEDALKELFPDPPIVTSLPKDVHPDALRFLFKEGKRQLAVTGKGVQLTLSFPDGFPIDATVKTIVSKYATILDKMLDTILKHQTKHYSGIIIFYTKKYNGKQADVANITSELLMKPNMQNLCSLNVSIGYLEDNIARTIEIAGYKTFTKVVQLQTGSVGIDAEFEKEDEYGMQVKIDVNTKYQADNNLKGAFSLLVPHLINTAKDKVPLLLGDHKVTKGL